MISAFNSACPYDYATVNNWNSTAKGVYYLGVKTSEGKLTIYYIGIAVGEDGIRGRLLQHLGENKWHDVTHFGYHTCDTEAEAEKLESDEIAKYKPKYNTQGK